jgi:hypothetical protein
MISVNNAFRKNALASSQNLEKFSRGSAPAPREARHIRLNIYTSVTLGHIFTNIEKSVAMN